MDYNYGRHPKPDTRTEIERAFDVAISQVRAVFAREGQEFCGSVICRSCRAAFEVEFRAELERRGR